MNNYLHTIEHIKPEEQIVFPLVPPDTSLEDIGVLDIETTGTDPKNSVATILGVTDFDSEYRPRTRQVFLTQKEYEKEAFETFEEMIAGKRFLVTFNGDSFDLPYINEKFGQHGIIRTLESGLDIYKWAKKHQSAQIKIQQNAGVPEKAIKKPFGDRLTLKAIEKSVGINRDDTVFGITMIEKYHLYEFCYKTAHSPIENNEFEIRLSLSKDKNVYDIFNEKGEQAVRDYLLHSAINLREELLLHNWEDTYNLLLLFSKIVDRIYTR